MEGEPEAKRIRISIEPHNEKRIYSTAQDGKEHTVVEPSPSEKFALLIRQIDFQRIAQSTEKDATSSKKEKDKEKQKSAPAPPKWPWFDVVDHLFHGLSEIEQMLLLVKSITDLKDISAWNITKPTQSIQFQANDMAIRVLSKQKALNQAASILSNGADFLKSIVSRDKLYFDQLVELRKSWIITKSKTLVPINPLLKARVQTRLNLDCSFSSVGSPYKVDCELIQTPTGHASFQFNNTDTTPAYFNKRLIVKLTSQNATAVYKSPFPYKLITMDSNGISESDGSVESLHSQLENAQTSQFYAEMLKELSSESRNEKLSPLVQACIQVVDDKHVRIQLDRNVVLSLQLKTVTSTPDQEVIPHGTSLSEKMFDIPLPVIEVILAQLLRTKYRHNFIDYDANHNSNNNTKKIIVVETFVSLLKHYYMCYQVYQVLCHISRHTPGTSLHTYPSSATGLQGFYEHICTHAFQLTVRHVPLATTLDRTIEADLETVTDITVENHIVRLYNDPNFIPLLSVTEVARCLLLHISKDIMSQLHKMLYSLFFPAKHIKLQTELGKVTLVNSLTSVTISLELQPHVFEFEGTNDNNNDEYKLEVLFTESDMGFSSDVSMSSQKTTPLDWNLLPGDTALLKLYQLITNHRHFKLTPPHNPYDAPTIQSPISPGIPHSQNDEYAKFKKAVSPLNLFASIYTPSHTPVQTHLTPNQTRQQEHLGNSQSPLSALQPSPQVPSDSEGASPLGRQKGNSQIPQTSPGSIDLTYSPNFLFMNESDSNSGIQDINAIANGNGAEGIDDQEDQDDDNDVEVLDSPTISKRGGTKRRGGATNRRAKKKK